MTLRRPKKPGSRAHLTRTPAQDRAFTILRLRGLWWMVFPLKGWRRDVARLLIDYELLSLGAETQTVREARRRAELDARLEANAEARRLTFEEIPF